MKTCLSVIFVITISKVYGQYGQPFVGAIGQFTVECLEFESDVIQTPRTEDYEVIAGKPFAYKCEFTVDSRKCEQNPQSSGCSGVEIVWTLPSTLAQIQLEKGISRKTQNVILEKKDGIDKYTSWFNISDVGKIHDGEYHWQFNLKFEMRTVMEGSFQIKTIDMLQNGEPCKFDDSCESAKCFNNKCVTDDPSKFPWMIVGISIVALVVIGLIITLVAVYFLRNKNSNNRRHN